MKVLHLVRRHDDTLAWEAIAADPGEVQVVLTQDAVDDPAPDGLAVGRMPPLEYDEVVEMMEWADKVVAW